METSADCKRWDIIGKNKISGHVRKKALAKEMLQLQNLQGQGCKRVLAATTPRGHPCPEDNPNRMKKSLSEVLCSSYNSKKRSRVALEVLQGSSQPAIAIDGDVWAQNHPIIIATEHCGSPIGEQGGFEGSVHVHKYPKVSQAQEDQCQKSMLLDPLVRARSIEELLDETSLENVLNSASYGEELEVGCPSTVQYSREVLEHLLSLLPPYELNSSVRHDIGTSSSLPQPSEEEFKEKLRELAREEKKYKKKQAKKHMKELKLSDKILGGDKEVLATGIGSLGLQQSLQGNSAPKPPLAPSNWISSIVSLSRGRQIQRKKDLYLPIGASSGKPSFSIRRTVVNEHDLEADLSNWEVADDIPSFEVNSLTKPIGEFWEHMRHYAFEQATYEFPWHLDWNKQCLELKTRFTLKLRKIYLGPWDSKNILKEVGANLRERRTRLKRKFEVSNNFKQVSRPTGCTKKSWMIIYESTKDIKKQRKAKLCKEAVEKRLNMQGCTHRCGPREIKGLHDRFVDFFKQSPTNEELEYGKVNGWLALTVKKTTSEKMLDPCEDEDVIITRNNLKSTSIDLAGYNMENPSCSRDPIALRASSDSSSDGDTSISESQKE